MNILKRRPLRNQQGASAIEYALVIAFVALAIIAALTAFSDSISTFLGNIGTTIENTGAGGGAP